jgi:uncharacterized protein DUF6011
MILPNDPLDELFNNAAREPARKPVEPPAHFTPAVERAFTEVCQKCRGTGRWGFHQNRPCFGCKGTGKFQFKTSADYRAKARAKADEKRTEKHMQLQADTQAWIDAHKAEAEWLVKETSYQGAKPEDKRFSFPGDMLATLGKFGSLTEGQLAAVRKLMTRATQQTAERTSEIDASRIAAAFDYARAKAADDGDFIRGLRIRFNGFSFSPDRHNSAIIWINSDNLLNDRGLPQALGKIESGRFIKFRSCSDEMRARIADVARDPGAAVKAHGLQFKYCACCGRELTNAESRERGVGPICAERYGF